MKKGVINIHTWAVYQGLSIFFWFTSPWLMNSSSWSVQSGVVVFFNNMFFFVLDEAFIRERKSLQQVCQLVIKICESLALWKLLSENQFQVTTASLKQVTIVTYRSLVIWFLSGNNTYYIEFWKLIRYLENNVPHEVNEKSIKCHRVSG